MLQRLFLHFFDPHFLEEVVGGRPGSFVLRELSLATRLAVLASREVLVPAASYYEQPICRRTIDLFAPIFETGAILLVGGGSSSEEYLVSKLDQYRRGSPRHAAYRAASKMAVQAPPFLTRLRSTTGDLVVFWNDTLQMPGFPTSVFGSQLSLPKDVENAWASVPGRLGSEAFIVEYVQPLVFGKSANVLSRNRLHNVINQGYFASFAREFGAGLVSQMVYLGPGYGLTSGGVDLPYRAYREALRENRVLEDVVRASPADLLRLRDDARVAGALVKAVAEAPGRPYEQAQLQLALAAQPDLLGMFRAIARVPRGRAAAARYHRAVARFVTALFSQSLVDERIEEIVDGGTRRIDIIYRNVAFTGFFRWIHQQLGAPYVVVECKNYVGDPANPELDQVTGYFTPRRTRVGFLVCRSLKNRDLMVERCRYAAQAGRGVVVVLEDSDLQRLAEGGIDPTWSALQSRYLGAQVDQLLLR